VRTFQAAAWCGSGHVDGDAGLAEIAVLEGEACGCGTPAAVAAESGGAEAVAAESRPGAVDSPMAMAVSVIDSAAAVSPPIARDRKAVSAAGSGFSVSTTRSAYAGVHPQLWNGIFLKVF
jgi:hypothetical protein